MQHSNHKGWLDETWSDIYGTVRTEPKESSIVLPDIIVKNCACGRSVAIFAKSSQCSFGRRKIIHFVEKTQIKL